MPRTITIQSQEALLNDLVYAAWDIDFATGPSILWADGIVYALDEIVDHAELGESTGDSGQELLQLLVWDVEIRIDLLHVIEIFEVFQKSQDLLCVSPRHLEHVLRYPG